MFNIIYLVTAGEPGGATEILVTQAYKFAFERYRYGYAAAYSTVIFVILLVYGIDPEPRHAGDGGALMARSRREEQIPHGSAARLPDRRDARSRSTRCCG